MMIDGKELLKTKLSLLKILCDRAQIYRRSVPSNKKTIFWKNLKTEIKKLIGKIDSNKIKNKDIRDSIRKLSKDSKVSFGVAQKVINVYLKFYCVISNKNEGVLKELDCPIDKKVRNLDVIKKNKLDKISLKDLSSFDDYVKIQNLLEQEYGIRILADIKAYDEENN